MFEQYAAEVADVARIGLLFLDGDALEQAQREHASADQDDIDYEYASFNSLKATLLRIERIRPDLRLFAALWQPQAGNPTVVAPVVCGSKKSCGAGPIHWPPSPAPYWVAQPANPDMRKAIHTGEPVLYLWPGGASWYYPVRNSDFEIAGLLELRRFDPDGEASAVVWRGIV